MEHSAAVEMSQKRAIVFCVSGDDALDCVIQIALLLRSQFSSWQPILVTADRHVYQLLHERGCERLQLRVRYHPWLSRLSPETWLRQNRVDILCYVNGVNYPYLRRVASKLGCRQVALLHSSPSTAAQRSKLRWLGITLEQQLNQMDAVAVTSNSLRLALTERGIDKSRLIRCEDLTWYHQNLSLKSLLVPQWPTLEKPSFSLLYGAVPLLQPTLIKAFSRLCQRTSTHGWLWITETTEWAHQTFARLQAAAIPSELRLAPVEHLPEQPLVIVVAANTQCGLLPSGLLSASIFPQNIAYLTQLAPLMLSGLPCFIYQPDQQTQAFGELIATGLVWTVADMMSWIESVEWLIKTPNAYSQEHQQFREWVKRKEQAPEQYLGLITNVTS